MKVLYSSLLFPSMLSRYFKQSFSHSNEDDEYLDNYTTVVKNMKRVFQKQKIHSSTLAQMDYVYLFAHTGTSAAFLFAISSAV